MWRGMLVVALIINLSACLNMATTGAQAVYNRHSIQKNFNDQYLTMQAYQAIRAHPQQFSDTNIAISTFNGRILLAGQVKNHWQKYQAERIISEVTEVKHIYNLLTVESPSSSLVRISDAWTTVKVKTKLIASDEVDATQIKVVTENGTVYLMGILPRDEADAAVQLTSTTDGVERVVKIFSYLTVTK